MTPRLVYADWLEDHGDPAGRDRAEFIRVQMELENAAAGARLKQLRARERALWKQYGTTWLPEPEAGRPAVTPFQRGFYEELRLPLATPPGSVCSILANHPISRLRLTTRLDRHRAGDLAVVPELTHVRELLLDGCRVVDAARTLPVLFGTPFLSGATRLVLTNAGFATRDVAALVASPLFARLHVANLAGNAIGPGGAEQLAGAEAAAALRRLSLAANPIREDGGPGAGGFPAPERAGGTRFDRVRAGADGTARHRGAVRQSSQAGVKRPRPARAGPPSSARRSTRTPSPLPGDRPRRRPPAAGRCCSGCRWPRGRVPLCRKARLASVVRWS